MGKGTNRQADNTQNRQMIELQTITKNYEEAEQAIAYFRNSKEQGMTPGANDIMVLHQTLSNYQRNLEVFRKTAPGHYNEGAMLDVLEHIADTKQSLKELNKEIADAMNAEGCRLDAGMTGSALREAFRNAFGNAALTDPVPKNLLDSLDAYDAAMKTGQNGKATVQYNEDLVKVRQNLIDSCRNYMKNTAGSNEEIDRIIDATAATLGKQGEQAFKTLSKDTIASWSTRRHMAVRDRTTAEISFKDLKNVQPSELLASMDRENESNGPEAAKPDTQKLFKEYVQQRYENSRFESWATYGDMPWNKAGNQLKITTKEDFEETQKKHGKFFGRKEDVLYNGAARKYQRDQMAKKLLADRETVGEFFRTLNGEDYNNESRQKRNSPEYKRLLEHLKAFSDKSDEALVKNPWQEKKDLDTLKHDCTAYMTHYQKKLIKSSFADKRANEVQRLLSTLEDRDPVKKVTYKELSGSKDTGRKTKSVSATVQSVPQKYSPEKSELGKRK